MSPCDLVLNNLPERTRRWNDVSPRTREELLCAVEDAARGRRHQVDPCRPDGAPTTAKALGGAWGFSWAASTEGTRVRMPSFSGLLEPDCLRPDAAPSPLPFDPIVPQEAPGPLVRVLAGTTFAALNTALGLRGLTVRNQPGFAELTFGGVMMVGGHGSGLKEGNLASQVRSLDLVVVTAERRAQLLRLEPASRPVTDAAAFAQAWPGAQLRFDDALFNAAKVGVGMLGVLHSALIETRPCYRLEEDRDPRQLWRDFEKIERQVRDSVVASVHLWVNPYRVGSDWKAVQSTYRRSLDMQRGARGWGIRQADSKLSLGLLEKVVRYTPRLLPLALELSLPSVQSQDVVMQSPEALDFGPPNRLPVLAASCGVDASRLKEVLEKLLTHFEEQFGKTYVSSPIGLRWVKGSDAPLAPQAGRDTVMIEVPVLNGTPNQEETLEAYVDFMVRELGGRPHWGQRLWLDHAKLRALYTDAGVEQFAAARRELDPLRVFDNRLTAALGL